MKKLDQAQFITPLKYSTRGSINHQSVSEVVMRHHELVEDLYLEKTEVVIVFKSPLPATKGVKEVHVPLTAVAHYVLSAVEPEPTK
jgi:hypothetical protein